MERLKQKLRSQSGVSILLAMMLTLVATMICAVIIAGSVTAAARVQHDGDAVQDALTITSAARLISAQFDDASYQVEEKWTGSSSTYSSSDTEGGSAFTSLMKTLYSSGAAGPYWISVEVTGQEKLEKPVVMKLELLDPEEDSDGETTTYDVKGTIYLLPRTGIAQADYSRECDQMLFLRGRLMNKETETRTTQHGQRPTGIEDPSRPGVYLTEPISWEDVEQTHLWELEPNPVIKNEEGMLWG